MEMDIESTWQKCDGVVSEGHQAKEKDAMQRQFQHFLEACRRDAGDRSKRKKSKVKELIQYSF